MRRFDKVIRGERPNVDYWNRTEHKEGTEDEIAAYSRELRDA